MSVEAKLIRSEGDRDSVASGLTFGGLAVDLVNECMCIGAGDGRTVKQLSNVISAPGPGDFPETGIPGKVYLDQSTGDQYYWSGGYRLVGSGSTRVLATGASEEETSTTSTSPLTKITADLAGLPSGRYRVGWYYEWSYNDTKSEPVISVQISPGQVLGVTSETPSSATAFRQVSGFAYVDLSGSPAAVTLTYRSGRSGKAVTVRRARLEAWRDS